jgi:hypothetical protein
MQIRIKISVFSTEKTKSTFCDTNIQKPNLYVSWETLSFDNRDAPDIRLIQMPDVW